MDSKKVGLREIHIFLRVNGIPFHYCLFNWNGIHYSIVYSTAQCSSWLALLQQLDDKGAASSEKFSNNLYSLWRLFWRPSSCFQVRECVIKADILTLLDLLCLHNIFETKGANISPILMGVKVWPNLTLSGMGQDIFIPLSLLDQILSADFFSKIPKLLYRRKLT